MGRFSSPSRTRHAALCPAYPSKGPLIFVVHRSGYGSTFGRGGTAAAGSEPLAPSAASIAFRAATRASLMAWYGLVRSGLGSAKRPLRYTSSKSSERRQPKRNAGAENERCE
eukprot:CAMPEP_0205854460 /NCGR_PEP_ID=MMETSP1083-20121108/2091_1 /ASSEMBLY_ACC=CAM_ASM_000430 /TAXON_ID=97485 /ORGANISM="Prymnesium parvum, Strain Texoma1" /LENGTH=111 /DNA_ID=CAMNT_0053215785 /DNA_START=565 /DNA_END=900 /DNA_ORIENTATION=-